MSGPRMLPRDWVLPTVCRLPGAEVGRARAHWWDLRRAGSVSARSGAASLLERLCPGNCEAGPVPNHRESRSGHSPIRTKSRHAQKGAGVRMIQGWAFQKCESGAESPGHYERQPAECMTEFAPLSGPRYGSAPHNSPNYWQPPCLRREYCQSRLAFHRNSAPTDLRIDERAVGEVPAVPSTETPLPAMISFVCHLSLQ